MNYSLEHLPAPKQRFLARVVQVIRAAASGVDMLILYGSHARGDWVDDVRSGKHSDFAGLDPAFRDLFPRRPRADKRRLELLKDAYVKARYSLEWTISRDDLEVLAQRIAVLRERTQAVCAAYIDALDDKPGAA